MPDVILRDETDPRLRGKLTLAREARAFAMDSLRLDVGDSYTSFAQLEKDTLLMVVSAAYRTRLAPKTWWFPIVGHVPYRGYFDFEDAYSERDKLDAEGFDALARPASAFSTLGWFADPLLSTTARTDEVALVETILHELTHNHLYLSGQARFNESFAQFAGNAGAIEFFCRREGGGPDTVWCLRAGARWRDEQRFSRFLDPLVQELTALYGRSDLGEDEKLERREAVFAKHRRIFQDEIQPTFEAGTYGSFLSQPLNNATLLGRMRYYHRLGDFDALWREHDGDLAATLEVIRVRTRTLEDPWEVFAPN